MIRIIDGKETAKDLRLFLKRKIENEGCIPKLAVIQVGDDKASSIYVRNKSRACEEAGIKFVDFHFDENEDFMVIGALINDLNKDTDYHGIIVQQPLPKHLQGLEQQVVPEKDVDGFTLANLSLLFDKDNEEGFFPCTPLGIMILLDKYNINVEGKNVVIIGRSNIVGKPLALILTNRNATVTLCHSKTKDLESYCREADIIIAAVGVPKLVKATWLKDDIEAIIDVGINRLEDGTLCGDVDYSEIIDRWIFQEEQNNDTKFHYITPVPGGVGPMTIYSLLHNTYLSCIRKTKLYVQKQKIIL